MTKAMTNEPQPESRRARALLEVQAGIIADVPMGELTKQWALTEEEWDGGSTEGLARLAERNGQAQGYAAMLMLQPQMLNWVRLNWIWL